MFRTPLAALIAGLFAVPAHAADVSSFPLAMLDPIVVTATRIATPDDEATYASEVHTRAMIEQSGATTLFDYLAQHSSVQVMPSYGSRATPLLDMRGYGLESGYQNIVISLDGRRLNSIDMNSPLLGAIPLDEIERIEITKGSGSVLFGDGAVAGSIQIHTRSHPGVALQVGVGNHGARNLGASAAIDTGKLRVSASGNYDALGGSSAVDSSGHRDQSMNRNWRGELTLKPRSGLQLNLDASSARLDNRYVYALSLNEYSAAPGQLPTAHASDPYNRQTLASDQWRLGGELALISDWKLTASHGREDRRSRFIAWYGDSLAQSDYTSNDLALLYHADQLDMALGWQAFDGVRLGSLDRTRKDNQGGYAQGQYQVADWTWSAGLRRESVDYRYVPTAGSGLQASHGMTAWDLGANWHPRAGYSLFANLNQGFQAPDIDRFFNCVYNSTYQCVGMVFNGFIRPQKSRTFNLGVNHQTAHNRLKLALFRAELKDEIYYSPFSYSNTNLDKTHKYGLEVQDTWRFAANWSASLNYTWTRATIDRENDGGGVANGKDLPGVPRHGAVLGVTYAPDRNTSVSLMHTWRQSTWAIGDFDNNNAQRQAAYQSTDLAYRRRAGAYEWSASVQNLFAQRNGLWTGDDAIYPVNFTRNWRLGVKASF